jgi:hypothetical protein
MAEGITPDEARRVLELHTVGRFRMELVGAGPRARRRHEAREDVREALEQLHTERTRTVLELPDADLQWLLDAGWDPHRWPWAPLEDSDPWDDVLRAVAG